MTVRHETLAVQCVCKSVFKYDSKQTSPFMAFSGTVMCGKSMPIVIA